MAEQSTPLGRYLRVNLTEGIFQEEQFPAETLRRYPGGTCLGVKVLYDEVSPQVSWSDPENRFIVASGPLGGTRVNGSGTVSVITVGALTGGPATCQANGFLGAFLRQNGYDGLIIQGAAPRLSYLYIHDGQAELRDATHLAGVDTWEMIDRFAEELALRPSQISVFGIGPAGENLVRFAAFVGDRGHVGGHNGTGAAMGAKRLKAIVIQRGRPVSVADPEALARVADEIFQRKNPEGPYRWGTLRGVARGAEGYGWLPIKNYTTNEWDITPEQLQTWDGPYIQEHYSPRRNSCWACRYTHCTLMTLPEGSKHAGFVGEEPEYEQFAAFGPVIDNKDAAEAFYLANRCDRLGFENNEMGWVIGFCMECYEKGILTKEQLDGLEMTWGNTEAVDALMDKIARREGIGDLLAEGVMRAAQKIGGEAVNCAIYTMKGNSPRGHDHRARWTELFDTSVSDTGTMEIGPMFNMPADSLAKLGVEHLPGEFNPQEIVEFAAKTAGAMLFEDSMGTCRFNTQTDIPYLVQAVNVATGWNLTIEDALKAGRRAMHLLRAFNIRRGITPELDRPGPRYSSTPVDGPAEGISIQPH
ncbi:MAG: hypothetical protein H5T69_08960, partial [Chloroflexi bacterium]|nr:hypothetical protein [Chloroflexota bacterium]